MYKRIVSIVIAFCICLPALGSDWSKWRGPTGDGSWDAPKLADKLPEQGLPTVWEKEIGGGYSGITVVGNRLYTMDRPGGKEGTTERILCFNAADGELIWKHEYDVDYKMPGGYKEGPRSSVIIDDDRAYAISAMGLLMCLDAASGKVHWSQDAMIHNPELPLWGWAVHPTIYKNMVITQMNLPNGGCLAAYDKMTGKMVWKSIDDKAGYAAPLVLKHPSGVDQMIFWSGENVIGLDPTNGKVHWKYPLAIQNNVSVAQPIYRDGLLFVSGFLKGSRAFKLGPKLEDFEVVWKDETDLRGLMAQMVTAGDIAVTLDQQRGIHGFDYKTGEIFWDDGHNLQRRTQFPHVVMLSLKGTNRILLQNDQSELILIEVSKEGFKVLWRTQVIDETWAHPAPYRDSLILRSNNKIKRVKLPVIESAA